MTDLLSPASQAAAVDSSRPTTPADTVPPETYVGSTSQEKEVNTDKSARSVRKYVYVVCESRTSATLSSGIGIGSVRAGDLLPCTRLPSSFPPH